MTSIDFHVLPAQARRQHDVCVCELIERTWQAGRQIYVHCLDEDMTTSIDELLWTFHDTSFVPHAVAGAADAVTAKVLLGSGIAAPESMDVLLNLHTEVPAFFSQFEQVIETTGHDEHTRQLARERYRFYKDRGYPLTTHNPGSG
jgi:DNA polymerase-3 subunit chi